MSGPDQDDSLSISSSHKVVQHESAQETNARVEKGCPVVSPVLRATLCSEEQYWGESVENESSLVWSDMSIMARGSDVARDVLHTMKFEVQSTQRDDLLGGTKTTDVQGYIWRRGS